MAAILNGLLPGRTKAKLFDNDMSDPRWPESTITAPISSDWGRAEQQLPINLPPTPPQDYRKDGIFVVEDSDNEVHVLDQQSLSILPRHKETNNRASSVPRNGQLRKLDVKSTTVTDNSFAGNRYRSPTDCHVADPIITIREKIAALNHAVLSPVQEDFAKVGPPHRQAATSKAPSSPFVGLPPNPKPQLFSSASDSSSSRPSSSHRRSGSKEEAISLVSNARARSQSIRDMSADRVRSSSKNRTREFLVDVSNRRARSMEPRGRRGNSATSLNRIPVSSRDTSRARVEFLVQNPSSVSASHPASARRESSASRRSSNSSSSSSGDESCFSWVSEHPESLNSSAKTTPEMEQSRYTKVYDVDEISKQTRVEDTSALSQVRVRPTRPKIRTNSRSRGLYSDIADDFRHVARDVLDGLPRPHPERLLNTHVSPLESNPPHSFRPVIDAITAAAPISATTITPMSAHPLHKLEINPPTVYQKPGPQQAPAEYSAGPDATPQDYTILEALARHHREEAERYAALARENKKASRKASTIAALLPSIARRKSIELNIPPVSATKQGLVADAEEIWG